jgi:hypothetical protein
MGATLRSAITQMVNPGYPDASYGKLLAFLDKLSEAKHQALLPTARRKEASICYTMRRFLVAGVSPHNAQLQRTLVLYIYGELSLLPPENMYSVSSDLMSVYRDSTLWGIEHHPERWIDFLSADEYDRAYTLFVLESYVQHIFQTKYLNPLQITLKD